MTRGFCGPAGYGLTRSRGDAEEDAESAGKEWLECLDGEAEERGDSGGWRGFAGGEPELGSAAQGGALRAFLEIEVGRAILPAAAFQAALGARASFRGRQKAGCKPAAARI